MEFFIFKTLQVLSRESAIAMVTKILFFARRRSRRAKKRLQWTQRPELLLQRWRGDCQINELMRLLCSFAALHFAMAMRPFCRSLRSRQLKKKPPENLGGSYHIVKKPIIMKPSEPTDLLICQNIPFRYRTKKPISRSLVIT